MLLNIVLILFMIFVAIKVEKKLLLPSTLTLIILSLGLNYFFPSFLDFTNTDVFAEEMLIFIVILVLGDAFILKINDLKENWLSIFILAGVFVVVGVLGGAVLKDFIFTQEISLGAAIALFAMITATDPVSVISVFKMHKLPHKLSILAEGESLFNDAMALTMFSAFGLYMMEGHEVDLEYIILAPIEIVVGSIIVGLSIGLVGLGLMKTTKDLMGEFILILFIAYLSYFLAEHIHIIGHNQLSGLLSEIVAVLTMTTIIDKSYKIEKKQIERNMDVLKDAGANDTKYKTKRVSSLIEKLATNITDIKRQNDIAAFLGVLSILVNGILFVSLAHLVKIDTLILYWKEILGAFLLTTIIRFLQIGTFSFAAYKTKLIKEMNTRWFLVLSFAGIKGGLSVVMIHMMNVTVPSFEYKEMFEAIVLGVILLSTFVYVSGLLITIGLNKDKFAKEADLSNH